MTAEQFAYWLQGFAELNEGPPSAEQWQAIRDHLQLVFDKQTPPALNVPGDLRTPRQPTYPGQFEAGTILLRDDLTRSVC